jgi:hypothetical protein
MVEIDNEHLNILMVACKQEYPDIYPYVICVYSVYYVLNGQGIYGDEKEGRILFEEAQNYLKFNIRIE